jgi:hypothetical protein
MSPRVSWKGATVVGRPALVATSATLVGPVMEQVAVVYVRFTDTGEVTMFEAERLSLD